MHEPSQENVSRPRHDPAFRTGPEPAEATGFAWTRLKTVTALLLTAEEFPGELGESFEAACAAVGVEPVARGYGHAEITAFLTSHQPDPGHA